MILKETKDEKQPTLAVWAHVTIQISLGNLFTINLYTGYSPCSRVPFTDILPPEHRPSLDVVTWDYATGFSPVFLFRLFKWIITRMIHPSLSVYCT